MFIPVFFITVYFLYLMLIKESYCNTTTIPNFNTNIKTIINNNNIDKWQEKTAAPSQIFIKHPLMQQNAKKKKTT